MSSLKPEAVKTELPCSVFVVCNRGMGSSPFQTYKYAEAEFTWLK